MNIITIDNKIDIIINGVLEARKSKNIVPTYPVCNFPVVTNYLFSKKSRDSTVMFLLLKHSGINSTVTVNNILRNSKSRIKSIMWFPKSKVQYSSILLAATHCQEFI